MNEFVLAMVVSAVIVLLLIMWLVGTLFRRVGPNRALIVYGWGGTHIVTGGGRVVWPLFQSFQELSLELMSFDVAPEQQLYTSQGVAVAVEAVAQIKVRSDPESIRTAAEQFLTKPAEEREALLRLVMEGHLRGIVGLLKVEEIVKEPEIVAGRVRDSVSDDLNKMGLEVVSFTIKKVIDENDYDISANQAQQKVVAEQVRIDQVQRQEQIKVQELEVQRKALELEATVNKQAEAERRRIEVLAEAQRQKLAIEAAGQAEAIRLQGTAEAEIVRAKGQAEADAMHQRAEAYQEYSQAAVLDKLITGMPEVVRALAQSLSSVDKITVVSTGDGRSQGVSQITGEVAKMVAQVPELFETLTGQKVSELMTRLRALDAPSSSARDNGTPNTK